MLEEGVEIQKNKKLKKLKKLKKFKEEKVPSFL